MVRRATTTFRGKSGPTVLKRGMGVAELTREEVVAKIKELAGVAASEAEDDEDEGDEDEK